MLMIFASAGHLLLGKFIFIFSFLFIIFNQFVWGFSEPVITDYINKVTSSDIRATILSAHNMMISIIYASIIPFIGWIAEVYTLAQAFIVLGMTTLVIGLIMIPILFKEGVI